MVTESLLGCEDIQSDFIHLGLFIVTVIVGLLVHITIVIIIHLIASSKNPLRLLRHSLGSFLIAFATTSP